MNSYSTTPPFRDDESRAALEYEIAQYKSATLKCAAKMYELCTKSDLQNRLDHGAISKWLDLTLLAIDDLTQESTR